MSGVRVVILHRAGAPSDGPLASAVAAARAALADRHRVAFLAAGAREVRIQAGPPDDRPFGVRLREVADGLAPDDGLVVLGSGALARLTPSAARRFVAVASRDDPSAIANDRYSADAIGIARARETLAGLTEDAASGLRTDNALPRWLDEVAGVPVRVPPEAERARLAFDIDGPLDLVLLGGTAARHLSAAATTAVVDRLARLRALAQDRRAELLVAGRTSSGTLRLLERRTAARTRALIEERGLRTARPDQRPPASILGVALERDGPEALGSLLARFADGAIIDSRVLLAHRWGADERRWPAAEDRFASDLLLPDGIRDPWLAALTRAAHDAPIPVLLGAHTLVGPGLPLALGSARP